MAKDKSGSQPPEDFNFEDAIKELERIVERMERGEQPLEQAMRDFEHGMALSNKCRKSLDAAQVRMEKLIVKDGQESLSPMDNHNELEQDEDCAPF